MESVKHGSSEPTEFVESLNIVDMDIETLEQRLELATVFGTSCYLNATCTTNCSSNMGDPTTP